MPHPIHQMMCFVAVKRPVARGICHKLYFTRIPYRHIDRHSFVLSRGIHSACALCGHCEGISMQVNGMAIHAEIGKPDANFLPLPYHKRVYLRPYSTVKGKIVEIEHDHGIWRLRANGNK